MKPKRFFRRCAMRMGIRVPDIGLGRAGGEGYTPELAGPKEKGLTKAAAQGMLDKLDFNWP